MAWGCSTYSIVGFPEPRIDKLAVSTLRIYRWSTSGAGRYRVFIIIMKKISYFVLLSIIPMLALAQERVNPLPLSFSKSSQTLDYAVGWLFDQDGTDKWLCNVNCIGIFPQNNSSKTPIKRSGRQMSLSENNFIALQFKTLTFKDDVYYILLVKKWDGLFEYPTIGKGWVYYQSTFAYVFNEVEYQKIYDIEGEVYLKAYDKIGKFGESFEAANILISLKNDVFNNSFQKDKNEYPYYFPILKTSEGKIRFHLPTSKDTKEIADKKKKENPSLSFLYKHFISFNEEYFETSLSNFNKLLIDNSK